jgi:hypothetical protein
MVAAGIRIEGVRELTRALNKAGGRELTKSMGAANRAIGEDVIKRLSPKPVTVGEGRGARVRPSSSARLVQLLAGGRHRLAAKDDWPTTRPSSDPTVAFVPWGVRPRARRSTRRPNIAATALQILPDIQDRYLAGIDDALKAGGLIRGLE